MNRACFFISYYDDVGDLNFEEFMRYFLGDGSEASEAEFAALKRVEAWPFDQVCYADPRPQVPRPACQPCAG